MLCVNTSQWLGNVYVVRRKHTAILVVANTFSGTAHVVNCRIAPGTDINDKNKAIHLKKSVLVEHKNKMYKRMLSKFCLKST